MQVHRPTFAFHGDGRSQRISMIHQLAGHEQLLHAAERGGLFLVRPNVPEDGAGIGYLDGSADDAAIQRSRVLQFLDAELRSSRSLVCVISGKNARPRFRHIIVVSVILMAHKRSREVDGEHIDGRSIMRNPR